MRNESDEQHGRPTNLMSKKTIELKTVKNGKGSQPRRSINWAKYGENFDSIFKKGDKNANGEKPK